MVSVADDGRIILVNQTIAYNAGSMPVEQGYLNGLSPNFETPAIHGEDMLTYPENMIDCVALGSYVTVLGVGTTVHLYGIRG